MIADEIKRRRIKKKLSQEKLARLADISYNTIVKIETGSTPNPGIKTISKIAKALGVTVDELINPVRNHYRFKKISGNAKAFPISNGVSKNLLGLKMGIKDRVHNVLSMALFIFFLFLSFWLKPAFANNIAVENVSLTDKDTTNDTYDIQFDIAWDNSWFITGAPSATANWDATWVFAKYSTYSGGTWSDWAHCTLLNTSSVAPTGSQMSFGDTSGVYKGAFIYRSSAGSGSVDWNDAEIRWAYGTDGVGDSATVKVKVFAIEMVYIPTANFYVGDTDNDSTNCFYEGGTGPPRTEFLISSEGAITVADTAGNLYYDADNTNSGDRSGPIPAAFPKGYNAFYIMKYELSQGQYKDFLNTLTRTQQNNRTVSQTASQYVMSNSASVTSRSGIRAPASIPSGAITFGCDLDADATFNESDDGEWIAANYLSWMDVASYADWASLRPFTELELEKAARGGQTAVDDEYTWGSISITQATGITNSGQTNEVPSNAANCVYGSQASVQGPLRCGSLTDSDDTRAEAGAGYYGALELSGNVFERPVTVGNPTGRGFTGTHGDGTLSTNGNATNSDWPGFVTSEVTGATGSGSRSAGWRAPEAVTRVSDRTMAANTLTTRTDVLGGRLARTSP